MMFTRKKTVHLIVEDHMRIDALSIFKFLADFTDHIVGVVPLFKGKCFYITVKDAKVAAKLAQSGFEYEQQHLQLKLLGAKTIHVFIFVSVEFRDEDLIKLL